MQHKVIKKANRILAPFAIKPKSDGTFAVHFNGERVSDWMHDLQKVIDKAITLQVNAMVFPNRKRR